MTQALAVQQSLSRLGHRIVGVVAGRNSTRALPEFFTEAFAVPIVELPSPGFVFRNNRSLNLSVSIWRGIRNLPTYRESIRQLRRVVDATEPHLILNFFEPLTGLMHLVDSPRIPTVAVAHQYMIEHPEYVRPWGSGPSRLGIRFFSALVARGSWKLALSLYPAADLPRQRLVVGPPLLRREIHGLTPQAGSYYLVYLLNHGYRREIEVWHEAHPEVALHCFYDRPGAPEEEQVSPTLTFHRLSGEKFLKMMAGCRAAASTAGFESVCEAGYLGKPMLLVPVEGHIEQRLNAIDAERAGCGIADTRFNLDRLVALKPRLPSQRFRNWVGRADEVLGRVIGEALSASRRSGTEDRESGIGSRESRTPRESGVGSRESRVLSESPASRSS